MTYRFPAIALAVLLVSGDAAAHGGVVMEEDQCVINIGFYKAHFTVYQPDSRGNEEFCEDLPDSGSTIFVLDYLHGSLKDVPVDFRIIHDATELGRFARLQDVQKLDNLDQHTVYYQPPVIQLNETLTVELRLPDEGDYIGIVTAGHPTKDVIYSAVFPFQVGGSSLGLLLLLAAVIVALQVQFLISSGTWKRLAVRFKGKA